MGFNQSSITRINHNFNTKGKPKVKSKFKPISKPRFKLKDKSNIKSIYSKLGFISNVKSTIYASVKNKFKFKGK